MENFSRWSLLFIMPLSSNTKLGFIELHIAILLAGFTGVLGRLITLNEGLLVWYRVFLASGFILFFFLCSRKRFSISLGSFFLIGWIGLLLAIHWIFFYASIKYSNVSIGVVCFASVGFFTALLDPIMSKRPFKGREIIFSLLTILGIYLIFHFDTRYQLGIAMGILSSVVFAVMSIEKRRIASRFDLKIYVFYEMLTCFIVMSLFLPFYLSYFPVVSILPGWSNFFYLLFLVLFCTIGLQYLNVSALKALSPFTVNLSYNLEPVYSILLAMIIFSEAKELNFSFYIGLGLIVISVVLQSYYHSRK